MDFFPDHVLKQIEEIDRRCKRIREFITQRILREEKSIIRIYNFLEEFKTFIDRDPSFADYLMAEFKKKGMELDIDLVIKYVKGGHELVVGLGYYWLTIDGWLRVFTERINNTERVREYDFMGGTSPYVWLRKIEGLLEEKEYDIKAVAEWYTEGIKEIASAIPHNVDGLIRRKKLEKALFEVRIKRLLMKYLLPYFLDYLDLWEKYEDEEKKMIMEDYFINGLKSALDYDDGKKKISVDLRYYCEVVMKFTGSHSRVDIAMGPSDDGAKISVDISSLYTGRDEVLWFIKYLEDRLPKINKAFEMEAGRMGECMGILDKLIRKNPEIFL